MCFDDRLRKLFIGNSAGEIRVLNAMNGALMKLSRLDHHKRDAIESSAEAHVSGLATPTEIIVKNIEMVPAVKAASLLHRRSMHRSYVIG